jgi:hypothetical protein
MYLLALIAKGCGLDALLGHIKKNIYSGTPVDDHLSYATTPPRRPNFPQSRMVSSLISIKWPSPTRPPRYPDHDHWLGGSQTANSPLQHQLDQRA